MKNILLLLFVLVVNACANAPFPELDADSTQIASDSKNAVYEKIEKQPTTPVAIEDTKPLKNEEKQVKKSAPKKVAANKTITPVVEKEELSEPKAPTVEFLKETVYFTNGSSTLEGYAKEIKETAAFAKKHNAKVKVLGHASSRTLNTDPASHKIANFEASFNRAQSVANALIRAGVKKENVLIEALSDSRPAYLEVMPEGERLNRRAEIYVIY